MPRPVKYDREAIAQAALGLVRESGMDALNARAVAARMGCSTQPLYSAFDGMDDLRREIYVRAGALFERSVSGLHLPDVPPYKATGLALLRFANEESRLYRLLFLSGEARAHGGSADLERAAEQSCEAIMAATGYSRQTARAFHAHMFIFIQGLAAMIATGYAPYDEKACSAALTDQYTALRRLYC